MARKKNIDGWELTLSVGEGNLFHQEKRSLSFHTREEAKISFELHKRFVRKEFVKVCGSNIKSTQVSNYYWKIETTDETDWCIVQYRPIKNNNDEK